MTELWQKYYKIVTILLTFDLKYNILMKTNDKWYKISLFINNLWKGKFGGVILAIGDIIVGVDIGSSKVSAVIGEVNNFNQVEIIATSETKCSGMKKSQITAEDEIVSSVKKVISEIEDTSNISINSAYVTIPRKVCNNSTKQYCKRG